MLPSQICTNCAPIFFEYFQKNLETQAELRRMRDQIQKLNFTQELGTLKDASGIDLSISPQTKSQPNSKIRGKKANVLNLNVKENQIQDRHSSIITSLTAARSLTPSERHRLHTHGDYSQRNQGDMFSNVNTTIQPTIGMISPLERLRDFENQVSKKVDSFKKKLKDIAKSDKRPTYHKDLSARPKTTGKVLTTLCDEVDKSDPKVSMFSPGNVTCYARASPIEFNLTPKLEARERTEKGSGPTKGEWTVGTTLNQRVNTLNTDRDLSTHKKQSLETSIKKVKESFQNELEVLRTKSREISSPGPRDHKLHSPFFSPLRASELMTPNGHHIHPKTDDSKRNYNNFIKLTSTPLLDSIMSSPNENVAPKEDQVENVMSFLGGKQTEKKGSYRSNYYKELFNDPLDQSPGLVKTDKAIMFGSSKRDFIANQDDLQTIREDNAKVPIGYNSTTSRNRHSSTALLLENKNKSEEEDIDNMFESNYDRTRRKKTYDYTKQTKSPVIINDQSESWFVPVSVKGGRFYSLNDKSIEYNIGETNIVPLKNNNSGIEGGILVYNSISDALKNKFDLPNNAENKTVLEVKVQGANLQVNKNTCLFQAVTPIRAVYGDYDL